MNIKEIENFQKIGEGKCANIYTNEGKVYKILKQNSDSRRFYNKEMLEQLVRIKSDLCVFSNEILEDENGELLGYSMDLVTGRPISEMIKSLSFEELQVAIEKAKNDIGEISDQKILFEDMHYDNVMWDEENKNIRIIDTDFFVKVDNNVDVLHSNNMKFDSSIISMIEPVISKYGITQNEQLKPFYDSLDLTYKDGKRLSISEYILNLKSVMEKDFNKQFNNLGEIEEALQEKQEEIEWQQHKEQISNNLSVKEKIVRFLVNNQFLRKLPFVDKMITKQIKMLPSVVQEIINESNSSNNLEQNEEVNKTNSISDKRNRFVEDINVQINEKQMKKINNVIEETKVAEKSNKGKSEGLEK